MIKDYIFKIIKYLTLIIMAFIILLPLYLILVTAFKGSTENSAPYALPNSFLYLTNFWNIIEDGVVLKGYYNTIFILVLSLAGNILIGTGAAFALGRFKFRLKKLIMALYTVSIIIPTTTTQVATFGIIKSLHLVDTSYSVILLYLGTDVIQLYIYLQFIKKIPYTLDESAFVEGAGYFTIYRVVILPLLVPAIVTASILKIVWIYNDMFLPYLYMPGPDNVVVSTALMQYTSLYSTDFKLVSAATIMIITPVIILYLFLQRYIFSGIIAGAVKE
jgi:raffinose/stachyose/melibiose transport system permease protein